MGKDRIKLTVPARGDYARTVRMTAAELATRMRMSYDEVDDVRMAIEEAFVYACECAEDDHEVTFEFTLGDGELSATVGPLPVCDTEEGQSTSAESYAEFILRSVCDEFSIEHEAGSCTLRLARRIGTTPDGDGA
jgi:serine/threonine-protein kinase RsbW